jgi:hypothetical protein
MCGEDGHYLGLSLIYLNPPPFEISGMALKGDLYFLKD